MKSRTLVLGDIHGSYKALVQCLDRAKFVWGVDKLIFLGDVCDGWPDVKESVDLLLSIPNLVHLIGDHDYWTIKWMENGSTPGIWVHQGGLATLKSYDYAVNHEHMSFLKRAQRIYVDSENRLYVHGGIELDVPINEQIFDYIIWDRDLAELAWNTRHLDGQLTTRYKTIFLGHTTTSRYSPDLKPIHARGVYLLDTGAGWEGKLTIMDVETKEYWQSDVVENLYPGVTGRRMRKGMKGLLEGKVQE